MKPIDLLFEKKENNYNDETNAILCNNAVLRHHDKKHNHLSSECKLL